MAKIDREKVINDLQDAVNDDWMWQHADYYAKAMENAISLLKEQEAVKPINMENDIVYGLSEISLYLSNIGEDDFAQTIEDACKKLELLKQREEQIKNRDESLEKAREEIKWLRKMLKEQEVVEPTLIREGRNKYYNDYVCPRCDNVVIYEQNYCSECGIPFMWKGR